MQELGKADYTSVRFLLGSLQSRLLLLSVYS